MDQQEQVQQDHTQRTVLHCPRCSYEFRREYVPAAALKDARAELARYERALREIAARRVNMVDQSVARRALGISEQADEARTSLGAA